MLRICNECNYIGEENRRKIYLILPVILIILALDFLRFISFFKNDMLNAVFYLTTPIVWLLFAAYSLKIFIDKPEICPNCKKKRIMIPLDTPRAQELIKEHNLTVPTSTIPETNPNPK